MKQRRWKHLAAALALSLSLTACGTVPADQPGRTVKLASEEQVTCIDVPPLDEAGAAKLTDFGLRLAWHSMANGRSALVSPMSVATALAMTANGAEGATLAELEDVLGLDKDALNGALCAWWASLPESDEAAVRSANSIWFTDHDRFTVDQEFLKTCTATYGAELFQTPMDAGTSRDINRWVKEKTEGMVPKIVDEVPESAVMYLVNALAFEGTWAEPYRKQQVQEGVFLTDSVPVQTTFLYSQETQYLENELATGVMKPYAGGEYAFAALLPKGNLTLMALLDQLDGETLQALLRAPQKAAVQTAIPKFETRDSGRLREALTDMGLSRAFTEQAELGGVGTSTAGPIFLSDVLHETFLSLGEQGTRAGAAAAVELCDGCAMPHKTREVVLDRPFVYFLVDTKTCVPLFIGTMRDPTAAAPEQPAGGAPLSVHVAGSLYEYTGREWEGTARCGTMDGEITSSVGPGEVPARDGQSNFGTGWGYQGSGDTISVNVGRHWLIFDRK